MCGETKVPSFLTYPLFTFSGLYLGALMPVVDILGFFGLDIFGLGVLILGIVAPLLLTFSS